MIVNGIEIQVLKKDIKNIHLGVYPPDGRVRVAAPKNTTDENIRLLIVSKLNWIKKQQEKFSSQERQSRREYVSGESYYLWGKRYLLRIIEHNGYSKVEIENKKYINLYVKKETTLEQRERILNKWYRNQIKSRIPDLIKKWESIIGVEVKSWGVRVMRTKWGTCNQEERRIWLNLQLAKRPPNCLEYVVVHEMIHLIERTHNEKFKELMDKYYPNWRIIRDELNKFILEHLDS